MNCILIERARLFLCALYVLLRLSQLSIIFLGVIGLWRFGECVVFLVSFLMLVPPRLLGQNLFGPLDHRITMYTCCLFVGVGGIDLFLMGLFWTKGVLLVISLLLYLFGLPLRRDFLKLTVTLLLKVGWLSLLEYCAMIWIMFLLTCLC